MGVVVSIDTMPNRKSPGGIFLASRVRITNLVWERMDRGASGGAKCSFIDVNLTFQI